MADSIERFLRRHLRNSVGRLEEPGVVALLHGSLAGLHRTGEAVPVDVVCKLAAEEGWPQNQILILRGIALVAENATADLGELTTMRAADGTLVVRLTQDEAKLARAALAGTLYGPYSIPEWEFHTLMGFRTDEAQALLDALGRAIGERIGEHRDGRICVAEFFPPEASTQLGRWKAKYAERLGPIDDWVIDVGRSRDGDFTRVWIPEGREP